MQRKPGSDSSKPEKKRPAANNRDNDDSRGPESREFEATVTAKRSRLVRNLERRQFQASAELAEQLSAGDFSGVPNLKAISPIGMTTGALSAEYFLDSCSSPDGNSLPYLMETDVVETNLNDINNTVARIVDNEPDYNRFKWWGKASGSLATGAIVKRFRCEFNAPLTTIVGSNLGEHAMQGYRTIDWSSVVSPNAIVGSAFSVRVQIPEGVPKIVSGAGLRTAEGAPPNQTGPVLINSGFPTDPPRVLGDDEFRPSLWLDFVVPQRAVGLEFGVADIPLDTPDNLLPRSNNVKLFAYDANGELLADVYSDGKVIPEPATSDNLQPDFISRQIGVRDGQGRISSVELRLEYVIGGGEKHVSPQIVHRVWSEPLPPAAVFQGAVAIDYETQTDGDYPALPTGVSRPPASIRLPYQFDRAAVFMRGYKLEFLDGEPYKVRVFGARLLAPPVIMTAPGGNATIDADGWLTTDEDTPPPYRITVYYSLIGWHHERAELFTTQGSIATTSSQGGQAESIMVSDPCPVQNELRLPASASACGPVWGGLQDFQFDASAESGKAQEIRQISFELGNSEPAVGADTIARVGRFKIAWGTLSQFDGKDTDAHYRRIGGTVVTGRSLRAAPEATNFSFSLPGFTRRVPGDWYLEFDQNSNYAIDLEVDMPFLAMQSNLVTPRGKIRELEVEMQGTYYNGRRMAWRLGGGLSNSSDDNKEVIGVAGGRPMVAGIVRKSLVTRGRLVTQNMIFGGVVGQNSAADQIGVIHNAGDAPVMLSGFAKGTDPDDDLFDYLFMIPRHTTRFGITRLLRLNELAEFEPIRLAPGDSILVGGLYTPNGPAGGLHGHGHFGLLGADVNLPNSRVVLGAQGAAELPDPAGEWAPAVLDFGLPIGAATATSLLVTTGSTPLHINRLYLEDPGIGFSFSQPPPIDVVNDAIQVIVTFEADRPPVGEVSTRLIADTNAGNIALSLRAGVPRGPTPR